MSKNLNKELIQLIKQGKVFIYPTDTVYGIGCNALNKKAVDKIKAIKGRDKNKPLSLIAPSKSWIFKNLIAKKSFVDKYLPGRYTLIIKKRNQKFLRHVSPDKTLGVRIPKHWFSALIRKAGVPFITTSANLSGEKPATYLKEIKRHTIEKADVIVNGGKLNRRPSALILPDGKLLRR